MTYLARSYTPGNGTTQDFALSFDYLQQADIHVYLLEAGHALPDAVEKALTTDYSFSSASVIRFVTPPPAGQTVILRRITPSGSVAVVPSGTISSSTLNDIHRQLLYVGQEGQDATADLLVDLGRSVRMPSSVVSISPFATPTLRAGKVVGFDTSGNPIPVTTDSSQIAASVAAAAGSATSAGASEAAALGYLTSITALAALLPHRTVKGATTSITSSTTLTADPDITVPIAANVTLVIRGMVLFSASGAGDLKWTLAGPSGATIVDYHYGLAPGDLTLSGMGSDVAFATVVNMDGDSAGTGVVNFEAVVTNGSTAGTVDFKWAQRVSDATPTSVLPGSYIETAPAPSTIPFGFSATGLAHVGAFDGPVNNAGHNYYTSAVNAATAFTGNSYVEAMVTGTGLAWQVYGGSAYVYTVDGVVTSFTAPGSGWSWYTLYTGLADITRRVRLLGYYIESDALIRVTGAGPALARPSDTPPYFALHTSSTIAKEGETSHDLNLGYTVPYYAWGVPCGFGARFTATTTSVRVWAFDGLSPSKLALYQDGVEVAVVALAGTLGKFTIITLATGLSGTHTYEVVPISAGPLSTFMHGILVDSLGMASNPRLPLDLHFGDSIVAAAQYNSSSFDVRQHDAFILARGGATPRSAVRRGYSGQRVSTYLRDRIAGDIAALPQAPARLILNPGVNDAIGGVSLSVYQDDWQTLLGNARAAAPSMAIYAKGMLPTLSVSTTVRTNYNAKLIAAIAAVGDGNTFYVNTDGWINPATDTTDATLHPNSVGYAKIGAAEIAAGL